MYFLTAASTIFPHQGRTQNYYLVNTGLRKNFFSGPREVNDEGIQMYHYINTWQSLIHKNLQGGHRPLLHPVSPLLPVPSVITESSNMLTRSLEEEREVVGMEMQGHIQKKPTGETPENAVSFSPQRQTRGSSTLSPLQSNRWVQRL